MKTAALVAIGDELLSGIRREGNCSFLSRLLHDAGWNLERIEVVPDELRCVEDVLNRWIGKVDILVMSGGLGPTHDDKTRFAVAQYLKCELALDNAQYDRVLSRYGEDFRELLEKTRNIQALIPVEAKGVYNPAGSALGIFFERSGTKVWVFPGVPFEYKAMARAEILPVITSGRDESYTWKSAAISGVPESLVAERVPELVADWRLHISILPSFGLVEFVIRGEKALVESSYRLMYERFQSEILPYDCVTLPEAILKIGKDKNLTISFAESCTGGLLGAALTDLPGSSRVFIGSAVVYSNEAKKRVLGVSDNILSAFGAVSKECAEAMAKGALALYDTSISVAVTGIAGPDGGSEEKPVGTVWFAVASKKASENEIECASFVRNIGGGYGSDVRRSDSQDPDRRALIRERTVRVALTAAFGEMKIKK
ncbi:putative competence-damage inducible protein [Synergistales bacterium]|nr:putative competence-damage inducible protein [Synergistales bacterium]